MPIEIESPEELGYDAIAHNLSESSFSDMRLADYGIESALRPESRLVSLA